MIWHTKMPLYGKAEGRVTVDIEGLVNLISKFLAKSLSELQ